jgi:hypothetical protein
VAKQELYLRSRKRAQSIGSEGSWPHNVIVPIRVDLLIGTITNLDDLRHGSSMCSYYGHSEPI